MATTLLCPDCLRSDQLGTIERITGVAALKVARTSEGTLEKDYSGSTDVDWDSSTTVGIECQCGYSYRGKDWADELLDQPTLHQLVALALDPDHPDPDDVVEYLRAASDVPVADTATPRVKLLSELVTRELGSLHNAEWVDSGLPTDVVDLVRENLNAVADAVLSEPAT